MRVCGPRQQHFFEMWPAVRKVCPPLGYNYRDPAKPRSKDLTGNEKKSTLSIPKRTQTLLRRCLASTSLASIKGIKRNHNYNVINPHGCAIKARIDCLKT